MLYAYLRDGVGGYTSLGFVRLQEASGPIRGAGEERRKEKGNGGGISHSMTRQTRAH